MLVTNGLLGSLLVTGGLGIGVTPPVTNDFHVYVDPRGAYEAGEAFLPRETTLTSLASNPFNADRRGTTLAPNPDPFGVDPRGTIIAIP